MICKEQGFTLVEIMAVVFIIGVMVALAAVRVGGLSERELGVEAQRLYQKLRLLAEEAEFSGVEMGLIFTDEGYESSRFDEPSLQWVAFTEGNFKPTRLEERFLLVLEFQEKKPDTDLLYKKERREKSRDYGEKKHEEPDIIFFSDGELISFKITLSDKNIPGLNYVISGESPRKLSIQAYEK